MMRHETDFKVNKLGDPQDIPTNSCLLNVISPHKLTQGGATHLVHAHLSLVQHCIPAPK